MNRRAFMILIAIVAFLTGSASVHGAGLTSIICQAAGPTIAGIVSYCPAGSVSDHDSLAVPDVRIAFGEQVSDIAATDEHGYYETAELESGESYMLRPEKTGDARHALTAYDASLVLRYSVGLTKLDPCQLISGDVSGNQTVSAYDAAFILRYVIKVIDALPVGKEWTFVPSAFVLDESSWRWAPDSLAVPGIVANVTDADFRGILYGDVSGNWVYNGPPPSALHQQLFVSTADRAGTPMSLTAGDEFTVPVEVANLDEFFAATMRIHYDSELLELVGADATSATDRAMFEKRNHGGELAMAVASAQPMPGVDPVALLTFRVREDAIDASGAVAMTGFTVDECPVEGLGPLVQFRVSTQPDGYHLAQNYPNPFNPATTIEFSLGERSDYRLTIFNVAGQEVASFENTAEAGDHTVIWDASDHSSGVYFYRLKTGAYSATKKMVLLK